MDRVTVVRSMTHPYPVHGVAYAVSGIPTYTPALETAAARPAALAVHRLGRRLPGERDAPRGQPPGGAAQHRPAVGAELEDRHRSSTPARTPRSWARRTTRSGPTSTARAHEVAADTAPTDRHGLPRPVRRRRRRGAASALDARASPAERPDPERLRTAPVAAGPVRPGARPRTDSTGRAGRSTSTSSMAYSLLTSPASCATAPRHRPRADGASASATA